MTRPVETRPGEFTGRHMLLIMFAFFGVIITVNLVMATFARTTWTGLVVQNTYVASQEFNRKAELGREQAALGWTGRLSISDGVIGYRLTQASGDPVDLAGATATLRRPVTDRADMTVTLAPDGHGALAATLAVNDGAWIVEISADAGLAHPYRDVVRIFVRDGATR